MRVLSTLVFALLFWNTNAQITQETVYDHSDALGYSPIGIANLESAGKKYRVVGDWQVKLYNLNHSIYKTINIDPTAIVDTSIYSVSNGFNVLYVKEHLFDLDNEVEFLVMLGLSDSNGGYKNMVAIINETGAVLFVKDNAGIVYNANDVLTSIFNTANDGTKMILSSEDRDSSFIYSLPGHLSCDPCGGPTGFRSPSSSNSTFEMESSPNPAQNYTNIHYQLPKDAEEAVLSIYNINGIIVQQYTIDQQFDHLRVSTQELPTGTYLYSIRTDNGEVQSKKMIVVK